MNIRTKKGMSQKIGEQHRSGTRHHLNYFNKKNYNVK